MTTTRDNLHFVIPTLSEFLKVWDLGGDSSLHLETNQGILLQTWSRRCPSSHSHLPSPTCSNSKARPPWPCSKGEKSPARCPVPGSQGGAESCCSSNYFFFLFCFNNCFSGEYSPCFNHYTSVHTVYYSSHHFCISCGHVHWSHPRHKKVLCMELVPPNRKITK